MRRRTLKSVVKVCSSTVKLPLKLRVLSVNKVGGMFNALATSLRGNPPTTNIHRLRRGLPGYLILFDPHAFVHQCQLHPSKLPSQSEFCVISKHFTATQHIPPTSFALKTDSFNGNFTVKLQTFTTDLSIHLRTL